MRDKCVSESKVARALVVVALSVSAVVGIGASSAAAAGDGYCGHGSHGIIHQHHFRYHFAYNKDRHDDFDSILNQWWSPASLCGHNYN